MASLCIRMAKRAAGPSMRSAMGGSSPASSCSAPLLRRLSQARCQGPLGCAMSLLPLHSAVAAARMTSRLATASPSCRALSQELGLSVPR